MTTPAARPVLNGRYELHSRIARGGMADVFLARDLLLDRPVAVKVLFPQFAAEPSFVERFRREAQAAAKLNHPSIVAVYDSGEHDNTYFIVMEYVEGRSLAEVIRAEGTLHPDRAAEIVTDVAAALGFAHRNGTVHRDVKPGNILITPSGQVKVTDFGIARAFGSGDDLTQSGSVMGTATYFSPEQAQGHAVDPRSDLYSLGVVLYEMSTGRPPFTGDSPVAIAYQHVQDTPPRPTALNPDIPGPLEAIIARLLAKNPGARYPSAEELRADLRRFREGQPLAGAGGAAASAAATATPGDALVPVGGEPTAAVPAVQAGPRAVIDATRVGPATQAQPVAQVNEYYEPRRRSGAFLIGLAILVVALIGLLLYVATLLGGDEPEDTVVMETVPAVINRPVEEATTILQQAGFEVNPVFEVNEDVEPDIVFDQEPSANSEAEQGSVVIIRVSQASETVTLPNLIGVIEAEAQRQLEDLGLRVAVEEEPSDDIPAGNVVSMFPEPGQDVNPETLVTLTVSSGPAEIEVPDVAGLTVPAASTRLGQEGLGEPQIVQEPSSTVAEGTVIRSDPPAGTPVAADRSITLVVSSGPETALVPTLVGLTQAAAETALQNKGFEPVVVLVEVPAGDDDGVVISQDPAPNEELEVGSQVTIQVSQAAEPTTTSSTTTTTEATTTTTAGSTSSTAEE